jgi:hypothetical protein
MGAQDYSVLYDHGLRSEVVPERLSADDRNIQAAENQIGTCNVSLWRVYPCAP